MNGTMVLKCNDHDVNQFNRLPSSPHGHRGVDQLRSSPRLDPQFDSTTTGGSKRRASLGTRRCDELEAVRCKMLLQLTEEALFGRLVGQHAGRKAEACAIGKTR